MTGYFFLTNAAAALAKAQTLSPEALIFETTDSGVVATLTIAGGNPNVYTGINISGPDAASFSAAMINDTQAELTIIAPLAEGSYDVVFEVTNSAGVQNFSRTPVINAAGALTLIKSVKVHSTSGSGQTDVPVSFGITFGPGEYNPFADELVVKQGASEISDVEEGLWCFDLENQDCRIARLCGRLSTLPGSGDVIWDVYKRSGVTRATPATKSIADLLALDTDFEIATTLELHNGMVMTASCREAMAASTTYDPALPHRNDGFILNGKHTKIFKCSVPMKYPDTTRKKKIRAYYYVYYYSWDNFDTLAGIKVVVDVSAGIYETTNTDLSDYCVKELTHRLGLSSPTIAYQLTSRSPAQNLVLTASGTRIKYIAEGDALPPGTFTKDDHGCVVYTGDGFFGRIIHVNDDGSRIRLSWDPAHSVDKTSIASGAWTVSATMFHWAGGIATEITKGVTEDYYPLPKFAELAASKMVFNYSVPTADLPAIDSNYTRAEYGDNPAAMRTKSITVGVPQVGTTMWNNTGSYDLRDSFMTQEVWNLQRVDAEGYLTPGAWEEIAFTDELWWNVENKRFLNEATGMPWHWKDNYKLYISNSAGKALTASLELSLPERMSKNPSHAHYTWYVMWLLKADWKHLEYGHNNVAHEWAQWNSTFSATESADPNKPGGGRFPSMDMQQLRSCVNSALNMYRAALCTPPSIADTITPYTRSSLMAWAEYDQERLYAWNVGDPPGTDPLIVTREGHTHDNTDATKPFLWARLGTKLQAHGYQQNYWMISLGHFKEIGMLDANGLANAKQVYRNLWGIMHDPTLLARGPTDQDVRYHMMDRANWNGGSYTITNGVPVGGPYPTFNDMYDAANGVQSFTNYIGGTWQSAALNIEHGFWGTPSERQEIYDAISAAGVTRNRIFVDGGGQPDAATVGSWNGAWQAHYVTPRS